MKGLTQKKLIAMADTLNAIDLTEKSDKYAKSLYYSLDVVTFSHGTSGVNGRIYKHKKTGKYYVVKKRCSVLFALPS